MILILVDGFVLKTKYDTGKSQSEKKYLILVDLLEKQTIMPKSVK